MSYRSVAITHKIVLETLSQSYILDPVETLLNLPGVSSARIMKSIRWRPAIDSSLFSKTVPPTTAAHLNAY
jgi:hypothetical protein